MNITTHWSHVLFHAERAKYRSSYCSY